MKHPTLPSPATSAARTAIYWPQLLLKVQVSRIQRKCCLAAGFTLVELLTVIAIIGILAAIIIPTVGKVRESARASQCISNLRQIGVAIALHAEDHKGRLPGPFVLGQGFPYDQEPRLNQYNAHDPATCTPEQGQYLPVRLGPYMGLPAAAGTSRTTSLFICPVFGRPERVGAPSYLLLNLVDTEKGSLVGGSSAEKLINQNPFGYPGATPESTQGPLLLSDLQTLAIPASRLWALADAFKTIPGNPSATWTEKMPENPIHGKYGNALFFDWHVGKIDSNGPVK